MAPKQIVNHTWLFCGKEIFPALLAAIDSARKSLRLEVYIFANDPVGIKFRDALIRACERGVRVQVLVDAFGSGSMPSNFFEPLETAGGEARRFNPILLRRLGFRDHRKLLVCDEETAFIGGFNFASEYDGDGVTMGWCDLGLEMKSPMAVSLAAAFDEMFHRAGTDQPHLKPGRRSGAKRDVAIDSGKLLLSGPGGGGNPFKRSLRKDLKHPRNVQIVASYFLPTYRIRRDLLRIARNGGRVQLILPAKCDVLLSQLAARSLYRRLLRAGVEIYEYEPQILHAKLIIVDHIVYAGSSNLDPRSLYINYELMMRMENHELVEGAGGLFARMLAHAKKIEPIAWRESRTWLDKLRQRWAYFLLVRIDPVVARWGSRRKR